MYWNILESEKFFKTKKPILAMVYHEQNKKSKDDIMSNNALTVVFFLGKILPNVNLKNMILTYAKDI
jgi:hypothetical protein